MEKENKKPRKISSTVLSLLLVFSVLTVMNFASMNVLADEDWNGDYTISGTEWYENTNITLRNGNLTIQNGGTLIFNNSVKFDIINPQPGYYGIKIEAGGKFIINSSSANTEIISGSTPASRTYWFTNSGTIDFLGATVEREV